MDDSHAGLPEDIDALRAALVAARAEVAIVRAQQSDDQAMIAHLKLQIEKLNRDRYGPRSERTARLLDQLEMQLEELEAAATEDELAAEMAVAKAAGGGTRPPSASRQRPSLQPFQPRVHPPSPLPRVPQAASPTGPEAARSAPIAGHSGRGSASRSAASDERSSPDRRTAARERWRPRRAPQPTPLSARQCPQATRHGYHPCPDGITNAVIWRALFASRRQFFASYPALCGRHVCCGLRQSIASSK